MKAFISPALLRPEIIGPFAACARQPARWYSVATSMQGKTSSSSSRPRTFRLAPSDFAFLWEECKRCFYLKAHGQLFRPRAPFPTIFGKIDLEMKRHFRGLRTTDLLPDMISGTFLCEDQDAWVESKPITPANHTDSVFIRGMIDCLVHFDDDTYGVIDFKTSSVEKTSGTYARQLHAYALALQNPSPGSELKQCDVTDLGLVVYSPSQFHTPVDDTRNISAALAGHLKYVNIPKNEKGFEDFLSSVLDVLTLPDAPNPPRPKTSRSKLHTTCPYCQFMYDARQRGLIHPEGTERES